MTEEVNESLEVNKDYEDLAAWNRSSPTISPTHEPRDRRKEGDLESSDSDNDNDDNRLSGGMLKKPDATVPPDHTLAGEVSYEHEGICLLANLDVNEHWKIRFVNLEKRKQMATFDTLDFEVADPELEGLYVDLDQSLQVFYTSKEDLDCYKLTLRQVVGRKMDFAIVKTVDGKFKRVQILHLSDEEDWEDFSDSEPDEILELDAAGNFITRTRNYNEVDPKIRVIDGDENMHICYRSLKWFYLIEQFCALPFRRRELSLTDMEIFLDIFEYVDVAYEILKQEDVFDCKVDYKNENEIPFVTLKSPKWEKAVNTIISIKTIQALQAPSLPPVGEARDNTLIVHSESNGEVFLHYKDLPIYELFETVIYELTEQDYLKAKAKGPFPINKETIYVAPYYGNYYRCKLSTPTIHDDQPELLDVTYFDYGNFDIVDKLDLVPCEEIDEVLHAFPKMAMRAHLRNVGVVKWDVVFQTLNDKILYVVETLTPETDKNPPSVELLLMRNKRNDEIRMLSDGLRKGGFAKVWSEELLPQPKVLPSLLAKDVFRPSSIRMGQMNWSRSDTEIVKAEPGAIIEVLIKGKYVHSNSAFIITPVTAALKLKNLKADIMKWSFWDFDLDENEYKFYRWRSFEMGNVVLVTNHKDLEITRRQPNTTLVRGRLIGIDPNREDFVLLDLDNLTVFRSNGSYLHPLGAEFCSLPAQAAILEIKGFNTKRIPNTAVDGRKFLVKVDSVDYEPDTGLRGCQRCCITGKLYDYESIEIENNPASEVGSRRNMSMTAAEAGKVKLGAPLTPAYFPQLGNFGNEDTKIKEEETSKRRRETEAPSTSNHRNSKSQSSDQNTRSITPHSSKFWPNKPFMKSHQSKSENVTHEIPPPCISHPSESDNAPTPKPLSDARSAEQSEGAQVSGFTDSQLVNRVDSPSSDPSDPQARLLVIDSQSTDQSTK